MKQRKIIIFLFCILLCIVFCIWQNNALELTYYTYSSDDISTDFDGYRIVQISDLHNKNFGNETNHLIEEVKALQPDMIVITGDIVDSNHTNMDVAIDFLEQTVTIAPCYYITGNHELWLEKDVCNDLMMRIADTGTTILKDETIEISSSIDNLTKKTTDKKNKDALSQEKITTLKTPFVFVGLDDGSLYGDTLHRLTKDIDEKQFVLLLAHEPQNFKNYNRENIDLILSGHAHGGQIRLPFVGGLVAPDQGFLPEYTEGLHVENDVSMIISRGLSNSVIPIRIFNRPEVVCIDLQAE